jgi:hypothetical protein
MEAIDAYKMYLAFKQHFSSKSYDYFKYNGRVRVSNDAFFKRRDKFFFGKLAKEKGKFLEKYLLANFLKSDKVWVGDLLSEDSESNYSNWLKIQESLTYTFKNEVDFLADVDSFDNEFAVIDGQHPNILRMYFQKKISLETLVILDDILGFTRKWDKEIEDPVLYPEVAVKIRKYRPFLTYDKPKYRKILKEIVLT